MSHIYKFYGPLVVDADGKKSYQCLYCKSKNKEHFVKLPNSSSSNLITHIMRLDHTPIFS